MKSHYAQYCEERGGPIVVESSFGFISYEISKEDCAIRDIWVVPEARKSGIAHGMFELVLSAARRAGCKRIFGHVDPNAKGTSLSIKIMLNVGFKILGFKDGSGLVYFVKEI